MYLLLLVRFELNSTIYMLVICVILGERLYDTFIFYSMDIEHGTDMQPMVAHIGLIFLITC